MDGKINKNNSNNNPCEFTLMINLGTVFARVICALFFYFGRWKIRVRKICGFFFCGGLDLGFIL